MRWPVDAIVVPAQEASVIETVAFMLALAERGVAQAFKLSVHH